MLTTMPALHRTSKKAKALKFQHSCRTWAGLSAYHFRIRTQYSTSVQPSIVMHWNTVSMAKAKLSKFVMPCLGPSQPALHSVPFWHCRPWADWGAQGDGSSSAGVS